MTRPSIISDTVEIDLDGRKQQLPLTDAICLFLAGGVPIVHAAQACGISERVYHNWRATGRDLIEAAGDTPTKRQLEELDSDPHVQFLQQTDRARSRAVSTYALELRKRALDGDVTAIKFFLSHSDRDNWYPRSRTDIASDGEIEVRLSWGDD